MQNLAIFGRSGAGKTNVAFHILEQLVNKKLPFLFLDWKRTARHLLPRIKTNVNVFTPGRQLARFAFNPFIVPPGLEPHVYLNHLIDILADAYTLGEGAKRILQKAISACYNRKNTSPSIQEILDEVEQIPDQRRVAQWKISAVRALESLKFAGLSNNSKMSQRELAKRMLRENTIIELDALDASSKQFLIPLLCFWVYSVKLTAGEREKLRLVLFIEEAHNVLYRNERRARETLMNRLLRQGRELGIGFVVIDQHPHSVSSAALGNTYTSICLNQKDVPDINRAAGISLVTDADKHHFSLLPTGQGVVKLQDRWRQPFLVQFPLVEFKKGLVTDAVLSQILKGELRQEDLRRTLGQQTQHSQKPGTGERRLTEDEYRFLHDVLQNPNDGVKLRYKRLGFSVDRGNTLKERLVDRGWLNVETRKHGRTRTVVLQVPPAQQAMLGPDLKDLPANLVVHEYWKGYYSVMLQEKGFRVTFEAPRRNGRVDILAGIDGKRVFVEVETGKSDYQANVRSCLLSANPGDRVLVVATSDPAADKMEKQLGQDGLLIPGKVDFVVRDQPQGVRLLENLNTHPASDHQGVEFLI